MIFKIPFLFICIFFFIQTKVELIVNGKQPKSFSEFPIIVVAGNNQFNLTDPNISDYLNKSDSISLTGKDFLSGLKTQKFKTNQALKVIVQSNLPKDSLDIQMTHIPQSGFIRVKVLNDQLLTTYILNDGKLIFHTSGIKNNTSKPKKRKNNKL